MKKEELLQELEFVCKLIKNQKNRDMAHYNAYYADSWSFEHYIGYSHERNGKHFFLSGQLHELYIKADEIVGKIITVDNQKKEEEDI